MGVWLAALGVLLPAGVQFQNVFWSTARVENRSGRPLQAVELLVGDAHVLLGNLESGKARFVRLPDRGDATLRVRFGAGHARFTQCAEYLEGEMYHVRVVIEPSLMADCKASLPVLGGTNMLEEMFR